LLSRHSFGATQLSFSNFADLLLRSLLLIFQDETEILPDKKAFVRLYIGEGVWRLRIWVMRGSTEKELLHLSLLEAWERDDQEPPLRGWKRRLAVGVSNLIAITEVSARS
jgi:hypothetical protein